MAVERSGGNTDRGIFSICWRVSMEGDPVVYMPEKCMHMFMKCIKAVELDILHCSNVPRNWTAKQSQINAEA
jgi:hypothetical protein